MSRATFGMLRLSKMEIAVNNQNEADTTSRFAVEIEGPTKTHLICDESLPVELADIVVWLGDNGYALAHGRLQSAKSKSQRIVILTDDGRRVEAPRRAVIRAVGIHRDI